MNGPAEETGQGRTNSLLREQLLLQLDDYAGRQPEEWRTVGRFRSFVEREPGCLDREFARRHVTGSAWVVDPTGVDVLLTHHRKLDLWVQLGGHLERDEAVVDGALREAEEESGLRALDLLGVRSDGADPSDSPSIFDLDIHTIPERTRSDGRVERAHEHFDVRFAVRASDRNCMVSGESHDLQWVRIDRLHERTREVSMLRMARKWQAGLWRQSMLRGVD